MRYPRCCCSTLIYFLLVIAHFQASLQLVIRRVNIPSGVKVGEEFVILDCDYDLGNTSTTGLVVKWYLNNFDLVYQWIYGTAPQAVVPASKYIDLHYKASEDPSTMYRAMKLTRPDIDLSGNYTCLISTFQDETSAKGQMMIYSTGREDEFKLWHTKMSSDIDKSVEVTCQAVGLYPKPTLDIIIEDYPNFKSPRPVITETENGHYNIVSYLSLEDDDLPDSVVINCILGIPSVNYNATKKIVHYTSGRPTTLTTVITAAGTTKLLRKMEIQALDNSQADASNGSGNLASQMRATNLCFILLSIATFVLIG